MKITIAAVLLAAIAVQGAQNIGRKVQTQMQAQTQTQNQNCPQEWRNLPELISDTQAPCSIKIVNPPNIEITIGPDKDMLVLISGLSKSDLTHLLSVFFAKGDEDIEKKIASKLDEADQLTLTITTKK